jgi:hypothetical protein
MSVVPSFFTLSDSCAQVSFDEHNPSEGLCSQFFFCVLNHGSFQRHVPPPYSTCVHALSVYKWMLWDTDADDIEDADIGEPRAL